MERTEFTVEVSHTEGDETDPDPQAEQPTLHIQFDGSTAKLRELLSERLREGMDATEIDISYRSSQRTDHPNAGVLTLSDRVTGAPILEVEAAPDLIASVVQTVRANAEHSGGDARYQLEIGTDATILTTFERELLLVYDADGTLRRRVSLIPSGVEI